MINPLLSAYVSRRLDEPTVILSFRILLENHLSMGVDAKMTKTEIETIFNQVHTRYGIATFRRDYVLRQCGHDDNAIDQSHDLFFIKPSFLEGMEATDYQNVLNQIDTHWSTFEQEQQSIINEIQRLITDGNLDESRSYIVNMLTTREAIKKGQSFEVSSFAVLFTYLNSLGFSLNRFSTTYSNDGGIDFVAQDAVYQVTTKLSERKFEEDIKKVPGKKRILVYRDLVRDFNRANFNHPLVSNHIDKNELIEILDYLIAKNSNRYLEEVLQAMCAEFHREFYQNDIN